MNTSVLILFRTIHVFAGALWIGAAIVYLFFIKPSVQAIGPAAPQFMQSLTQRRRYPVFMASVSLLTVLAGVVLYFYTSGGFNPNWFGTGPGLGYTIGSLAALGAFLVGSFGIGPISGKLGSLAQGIGASSRGPTPEQVARIQSLEKQLAVAERIDFVLLMISIVTMATARYWVL